MKKIIIQMDMKQATTADLFALIRKHRQLTRKEIDLQKGPAEADPFQDFKEVIFSAYAECQKTFGIEGIMTHCNHLRPLPQCLCRAKCPDYTPE